MDFNAAKFYCKESKDTVLLGTSGYAAPEQYGFGSSTVQSDIYALGIMFKEMLQAINCEDEKLLNICGKCTKLSPEDRYKNVKELKEAIYSWEHPLNISIFKPVGFRSGKALNMVLSSIVYIFMAFICFLANFEGISGARLWFNRSFFFILFISLISATFNYLDIQSGFPLCRSQKPLVRLFGILLMDVSIMALILISWMILEDVLFSS